MRLRSKRSHFLNAQLCASRVKDDGELILGDKLKAEHMLIKCASFGAVDGRGKRDDIGRSEHGLSLTP